MSNVIHLNSCPRSNGDMMLDQYLGDSELVCLQCGGHRISPPAATVRPAIATAPIKKAA